MYEEYEKLWNMISELKNKADEFESVDSKLQVWNEIDKMINSNVAPFLEVTEVQDIVGLLDNIVETSDKVKKSVIEEDIKNLQDSIAETKKKLESVNQ